MIRPRRSDARRRLSGNRRRDWTLLGTVATLRRLPADNFTWLRLVSPGLSTVRTGLDAHLTRLDKHVAVQQTRRL